MRDYTGQKAESFLHTEILYYSLFMSCIQDELLRTFRVIYDL